MRNKVKRTLSFLLTFVMLCGLLPMTAMAKEELQPGQVAATKTASDYDAENNEVTITMTVEGKDAEDQTTVPAPVDVVMVVDNSGSMTDWPRIECNSTEYTKKLLLDSPIDIFDVYSYRCKECGRWLGLIKPNSNWECWGSITKLSAAQKATYQLIEQIAAKNPENQIGIVSFAGDNGGTRKNELNGDACIGLQALNEKDSLEKLYQAVDNMEAEGGTNYTAAFAKAEEYLAGSERAKFIIFVSDGQPGYSGESPDDPDWNGLDESTALKGDGAKIYTIGLNVGGDILQEIASGESYHHNFSDIQTINQDLPALVSEIADEITTPVSKPAGTEAVMTDTINTKDFEYVKDSAETKTGTISVDNGVVTWNIGAIPNGKATATFKVKPIVTPEQDTEYKTNTNVTLTYKDSNDQEQTIPKEQIGEPKVLIPGTKAETVTLTYHANGGTGDNVVVDVAKNDTATLKTDGPTHEPKDGKKVEFLGWSAEPTDIIFESADAVPKGTIIKEIAVENAPVTVYAVWAYGDPIDPTTPEEKLPVFLYVLNQTDGETTDDPADYSYLATGAKVKAGTSMETPYTGEDAQNQIENWDQLKELGTHVGYAEVSSTPVGAESTWKMDENGNVISFSFIIDGVTYTDADYDFTWQKLNYIGASYKENEEDEELKPAFHLDGVLTEKEDPVDPENPEWQVSKGKTATALDSNYNSTVTLSLPSAEKPLVSDVVFVLDKSTSATVENQALGMLKQLKEKAAEDGATVKVGVVIFNKEAHVTEWKDLVTEYDAIEDAITQKISSGTNTHAGLLAAQKMLEDDKNVEDSRKHMIFVSDGITYIFEEPAQAINSQQLTNGEYGIMAGNDCWGIRHYYEGGDQFIPNDWNTYLQDVESHLDEVKQYIQPYDNMNQDNHIPRGDTVLPTTVDVALYKTAKLYHELSEKYHCYAVLGDTGVTNYPWGPDFMTYLADDKKVSFDDIQKDIYYLLDAGSQVVDIIGQGKDNQGKDYNFNVVNLENMTITVGGVELKKEKISDNEYGFGDVRDGIYDFKVTYYPEDVADADGETREHFVWSINVPVSNFAPVQFSYDVHLTDPQTTKGTYTVATNVEAVLTPVDSNGTKGKPEKFPVPELTYEVKGGGSGEDYRYVNVTVVGKGDVDYKCGDHKGTITEKDGTELLTLDLFENSMKFNMEPASGWKLDRIEVNGKDVGKDLEYKMIFDEVTGDQMDIDVKIVFKEKSDGGSGGGSHRPSNKPDKTPEALNGDDHFDYVVGYSDGLVHPERNITRAEVASIFFRLLQDDVREKNLTDQNPFNDVFTDDWFNVAVSTMYDMDIVYGRDNNNFDPNAYITRAEFAAIAARFDSEGYSGENLFTDIDGHWAANQINRAAEKGWISGYPDGTFGPDRYITRAEAVTMINRVLNRLPESADALHEDMNVFPDNMDTTAWYYLAIQEATSSHEYEKDKDGVYETWTDVLPDRDWAQYLKLN
ncbi:S-layer homology domain-containing protein [Anaerotignum lactatifermentans]|uniref:S-layer homology domain-containing protein n=1 Tax=Anaerotignum lactatifermentans TaxID=160404 RepID=UPI00307C3453